MSNAKLDVQRQTLNKWEMHKALLSNPCDAFHLPDTMPGSAQSLQRMLQRHPSIYIKPIGAWGGRGITRIDTHSSQVYVWQQQGYQSVTMPSIWNLRTSFQQVYGMQPTILQQSAPLVSLDGRPFDIRVLLQREVDDSWVEAGTVVRVGGQQSIVSNVGISHGKVLTLADVGPQLNWTRNQGRQLERNITLMQQAITQVLDEYRHFNEIGIDAGIDANRQLWLIEVNTDDALGGPSHQLFAQLPDKELYEQIQERQQNVRNHQWQQLYQEIYQHLRQGNF